MNLTTSAQVMAVYAQIDQATTAFQIATGIHCPSGCGQCCESPNVEATPLEMLPLALELFRTGDVDLWLEQVAATNEAGPCVFYKPDPLIPGNGRCQKYPWRPSVCRLFGFAAVSRKNGIPELAACIRHKQLMPELVDAARAMLLEQSRSTDSQSQPSLTPVPGFAEYSQLVTNLDPTWGTERMPINRALKIALERVGVVMTLSGQLVEILSDSSSDSR
jgi:Fe-S-cluster containining protein